jgi:hypothetical protein
MEFTHPFHDYPEGRIRKNDSHGNGEANDIIEGEIYMALLYEQGEYQGE